MRKLALAVMAVALIGAGACDGSEEPAAHAQQSDAAGDSATIVDAVAPDADAATGSDAAANPDYGPAPVAAALPATARPPQRFLGPADQLTGDGVSSCSNGETGPVVPAGPAHRWCAFSRPGPQPDLAELWVIDVTLAAMGQLPACDGTASGCIRLTSTLWTSSPLGGPSHPFSHRFDGDTLIYYADAEALGPQDLHRGPVYAWRSGWTAPRPLTSATGLQCFAHARRPLVFCLDDVRGNPMHPDSFEIRAGSVAEPPSAPLPSLGRLRPYLPDGQVAWHAAFSPDGDTFAMSSPDPDPAVESLRVVATATIGQQLAREVLRGLTGWSIAHDGKRIYFFRPEGTVPDERALFAADFPEGTALAQLGSKVRDYLLLGQGPADDGTAFLATVSEDRGAFRFLRNSRAPAELVTLFTYRDMLEGVRMSDDLRYTAWLDAGFNARVVRHSDFGTCRLKAYVKRAAFDPLFSAHAGLVFWGEDADDNADYRDGFIARPDDCGGLKKFAERLGNYQPVGDAGLVYTDEAKPSRQMSLKYAPMSKTSAGWDLGPPVRVADGVDEGYFTVIGSTAPTRLLLWKSSGPAGGTFVFPDLPF